MTIVTDRQAIDLIAMFAAIQGLRLEVNHGLGHSRNMPMIASQRWLTANGITPKRTKKAVLQQMETLYAQLRHNWEQANSQPA